MIVGLFLAGPREAKTFLGPSDELPLVAPFPLPAADPPIPVGCLRVLEVVFAGAATVAGGLGEPLIVLASCLDVAVSVDVLRCCC